MGCWKCDSTVSYLQSQSDFQGWLGEVTSLKKMGTKDLSLAKRAVQYTYLVQLCSFPFHQVHIMGSLLCPRLLAIGNLGENRVDIRFLFSIGKLRRDNCAFITGEVLLVIEIENTLSHSSPWGEDFPGLKSAWLLTQHPAAGFRDHIPLEVGLTHKLPFGRSELPQPSTCCNQVERVASSCINTLVLTCTKIT